MKNLKEQNNGKVEMIAERDGKVNKLWEHLNICFHGI